jgi:hypothetical protein
MPPPSQLNDANVFGHNGYLTRDSPSTIVLRVLLTTSAFRNSFVRTVNSFLRVVLHLPLTIPLVFCPTQLSIGFGMLLTTLWSITFLFFRQPPYHFYTCNVCDPVIAMVPSVSSFHRSFECHSHVYTNVSSRLNLFAKNALSSSNIHPRRVSPLIVHHHLAFAWFPLSPIIPTTSRQSAKSRIPF